MYLDYLWSAFIELFRSIDFLEVEHKLKEHLNKKYSGIRLKGHHVTSKGNDKYVILKAEVIQSI